MRWREYSAVKDTCFTSCVCHVLSRVAGKRIIEWRVSRFFKARYGSPTRAYYWLSYLTFIRADVSTASARREKRDKKNLSREYTSIVKSVTRVIPLSLLNLILPSDLISGWLARWHIPYNELWLRIRIAHFVPFISRSVIPKVRFAITNLFFGVIFFCDRMNAKICLANIYLIVSFLADFYSFRCIFFFYKQILKLLFNGYKRIFWIVH